MICYNNHPVIMMRSKASLDWSPELAHGCGGGFVNNFYLIHSNSNSLANQLGIHIILAKQEKLASNSLTNQLGKNRNLAKLTSPRAYMRARIVVAIVVSL
jgi:hypothetical protein